MKRVLTILFSLALLSGCSYLGSDDNTIMDGESNPTIAETEIVIEETDPAGSMDAEVEAIIEEEAAVDAELDTLEEEF